MKETVMPGPFYKVLVNGKSCHGGFYTYDLPMRDPETGDWTPGDWSPNKRPVLCQRGYHLTTNPTLWLALDCAIYLAEGRGEYQTGALINSDKVVYESVRLLRPAPEVTPAYLEAFNQLAHRVESWRFGVMPDTAPDGTRAFSCGSVLQAIYLSTTSVEGITKYPPFALSDTPDFSMRQTSLWLEVSSAVYEHLVPYRKKSGEFYWNCTVNTIMCGILRAMMIATGGDGGPVLHPDQDARAQRFLEALDAGWLPVGFDGDTLVIAGGNEA